jgi:hypothetical protein
MITKIIVRDHKHFKGEQELIPSKKVTMVIGDYGSGKTVLVSGIEEGFLELPVGVVVEEDVNSNLAYLDLIFVSGDDLSRPDFLDRYSPYMQETELEKKKLFTEYLERLLALYWRFGFSFRNSKLGNKPEENEQTTLEFFSCPKDASLLSVGERTLLNFFSFLSIRAVVDQSLPLVLDDPFSHLTKTRRKAMIQVIEQALSQVIIFLAPACRPEGYRPQTVYRLEKDLMTGKTKIIRDWLVKIQGRYSGVPISITLDDVCFSNKFTESENI